MLANVPAVRSANARYLFLTTAAVTVGILFWNHRMGFAEDAELSPIFYLLFVLQDHAGAMCALAILVVAVLVPSRFPTQAVLRWIGEHAGFIATGAGVLMALGAIVVYRKQPLSMDEYAAVF